MKGENMSRLHRNQTGLASIVIAIIISLILSTIVIGFARTIRREQRRSLDRQLSSQAFYAAETGINDARKAIKAASDAGTTLPAKTDCTTPAIAGINYTVDAANNVSYSCLLIDPNPTDLQFDSTKEPTVFPIEPSDGSDIGSVTFEWADKDGATGDRPNPGPQDFPTTAAWGSTIGVLRVELTPVPPSGSVTPIDRNTLISGSQTFFLYPRHNTGSATGAFSGSAENGKIFDGACNVGICRITITGVPGKRVYARVTSIYRDSTLKPTLGGRGFKNAQIMVDSTGKANDVLRRIQVRVPIKSAPKPADILTSINTLCKRFVVLPTSVTADDPDPACDPNP
jgi:hypothetical protein